VNDYFKYSLLRALAGPAGDVRVGVCWMLTWPDDRPAGNKITYLQDEKRWRVRWMRGCEGRAGDDKGVVSGAGEMLSVARQYLYLLAGSIGQEADHASEQAEKAPAAHCLGGVIV